MANTNNFWNTAFNQDLRTHNPHAYSRDVHPNPLASHGTDPSHSGRQSSTHRAHPPSVIDDRNMNAPTASLLDQMAAGGADAQAAPTTTSRYEPNANGPNRTSSSTSAVNAVANQSQSRNGNIPSSSTSHVGDPSRSGFQNPQIGQTGQTGQQQQPFPPSYQGTAYQPWHVGLEEAATNVEAADNGRKSSIFRKLGKVANPRLMAALFYGLLTCAVISLILVAIRPPFIFRRTEEPQYLPRVSVLTVLATALLCGAGVSTLVYCASGTNNK